MSDDLVASADSSLDEASVDRAEIEKARGLLSIALRGLELGAAALPPTPRGEPNTEQRLRLLKSMTAEERVAYRAEGRVIPVLIARRRAEDLLKLNPNDELAHQAHQLLTNLADSLLRQPAKQ